MDVSIVSPRTHRLSVIPGIDTQSEKVQESHETVSSAATSISGQITNLSSLSSKKRKTYQTSLIGHIIRPIPLSRQQKINTLILNLIIKDLQPLSVVEDKGFRELINGLEPSYNMPSRFTFTKSYLPQQYQQKKEKLKALISKSYSVALTTDAWTSQYGQRSYICYTAHFITENWLLYSCLLECGQYDQSHTALHLKEELFRVANEWEITEKVCTVTTDNAANVKAAVRLTEWGQIGCFAHTINLIVQSGLDLDEIKFLRRKVKTIVEFFHRSVKSNNKFIEVQKQMNDGATPLKLKIDVVTRWNSTFYMFERFLKIREPLTATMGILNLPVEVLSEAEWHLLNEICTVLKPFEQITVEMSAEKNVTLSKVIIIVKGLKSALNKFKFTATTSEAKILINHYEKETSTRFSGIESNNLMAKCALLDPRFKSKVFSSEHNFNMAKERLEADVARMIGAERRDSLRETEESEHRLDNVDSEMEQQENLIWADFDKIATSRKEIDAKAAAILECRSYIAEDLLHRKENPLDWWKARTAIYPHLSKIAKKYLCIIATSVPSERTFSTAGQVLSERRNRLKGENVEMIIFLHNNQHV